MPFAPQIRRYILQALEERVLPVWQSQVVTQVLAQPPHSHVETMKDFLMGGNQALMFAVQKGDLASAKLLVAAGADVNATSAWGFAPLTVAVYGNFGQAFRVYEGDVLPLDGERGIPGQDEFPELVEFLVEAGADPNVGADRFTAMHAAILRENEQTVRLLLDHGADPNRTSSQAAPTQAGVSETPALISALSPRASQDGTDIALLLIERGANVNVARQPDGLTPLIQALQTNQDSVVRALLARGADPNLTNALGLTPIPPLSDTCS